MPEREIDLIKNNLVDYLSPEKIYLFGSFANGTADEGSDFDFYIIMRDGTENLTDLTAEAYRSIRSVRKRAVDIVISTQSRFDINKNRAGLENEIASKGVLLYGKP